MSNYPNITTYGKRLSTAAGACAMLASVLQGQAQAAKAPMPPAPAAAPLGDLGSITLDAASNSLGQGYFIYRHAHMAAQNGTKLDADEIRANIAQDTNKLKNIVATGNVKTYIVQPEAPGALSPTKPLPPRTITVTSDKAVYDPATQKIDLTGHVRTAIVSRFTTGAFIQTGDSGVITLGATPAETQISMDNVHATFTPDRTAVPTGASTPAAPVSPAAP